jgi:hypothetical protein
MRNRLPLLLYTLAVSLSAFLLFWIEPVMGKILTPVFGGAPAVWNICLLFFQTMLLGGYVYAHLVSTCTSFLVSALIHLALFAAAAWLFPISLHLAIDGQAHSALAAQLRIFWLLSLSIGFPFFLLSSNSSLLQSWFAESSHSRAKHPFFLYAFSNVASLLALVLYPILIEPRLTIETQWKLWKSAYLALLAILSLCALWRARQPGETVQEEIPETSTKTSLPQMLSWIGWSFIPSSLLLGVTTYLSTDIIAVPLLWMIPLAIYLAAFSAVFGWPGISRVSARPALTRVLCLGTTICLLSMVAGFSRPVSVFIPLHLLLFALMCFVCLGRVASERPSSSELTRYYLCVALGGVLGAAFNGLIAPMIFNEISEYPLMMILACLCRPRTEFEKESGAGTLWAPLLCGALLLIPHWILPSRGSEMLIRALTLGPAAIVCYMMLKRPLRFGLSLAIFYFVGMSVFAGQEEKLLYRERTFYGTLKVLAKPQEQRIYLIHGSTLHGAQSTEPQQKLEPLSYYSRSGPVGQIFEELDRRQADAHIGVIGLGVGTLASYARPTEKWTFFELDAAVVRVAKDSGYFSFLKNSAAAASLSIVTGDARLSLHDIPDHSLSLLIVDAFNSDSIPAHLLTREALELYLQKIEPHGLIAFHLSNNFLNLPPVVGAVAAELGAVARVREDSASASMGTGGNPSIWAVVGRQNEDLGWILQDKRWQPISSDAKFSWSDDFYNLIGLMH